MRGNLMYPLIIMHIFSDFSINYCDNSECGIPGATTLAILAIFRLFAQLQSLSMKNKYSVPRFPCPPISDFVPRFPDLVPAIAESIGLTTGILFWPDWLCFHQNNP